MAYAFIIELARFAFMHLLTSYAKSQMNYQPEYYCEQKAVHSFSERFAFSEQNNDVSNYAD